MTEPSYRELALQASESSFTLEDLDAARGSFENVLGRLTRQSSVQRNASTPASQSAGELYVSSQGLDTVSVGAMRTLTSARNLGMRRPQEVLDERQVDQVVISSFGWSIDREALRTGLNSIRTDARGEGHNPYKVFDRIQRAVTRQQNTPSHIITRRGEIYNLVPWSRAPKCNTSQSARSKHIADRAISIELESWTTARLLPFRGTPEATFRIVGLEPYTDAQIRALAFLLKKLGVWCSAEVTPVLGFTLSEMSATVGNGSEHAPGIVLESAFDGVAKYSPGAEFELPRGWTMAQGVPPHLQSQQTAWEQRFALRQRAFGVPDDARISIYDKIDDRYAALQDFSFETQIFETAGAPAVYDDTVGEISSSPVAQAGIDAIGGGFSRSQAMQASLRSSLYDAAATANDGAVTAIAEYAARANAARAATVTAPIIRNALAFDFATGRWVYVLSTTLVPWPGDVSKQVQTGAQLPAVAPPAAQPASAPAAAPAVPAPTGYDPTNGAPLEGPPAPPPAYDPTFGT